MTTFLLILAGLAVLGGAVFLVMRFGRTKEQKEQLQDVLKDVSAKKEIEREVEALGDDALLKRWLKLVRKRS